MRQVATTACESLDSIPSVAMTILLPPALVCSYLYMGKGSNSLLSPICFCVVFHCLCVAWFTYPGGVCRGVGLWWGDVFSEDWPAGPAVYWAACLLCPSVSPTCVVFKEFLYLGTFSDLLVCSTHLSLILNSPRSFIMVTLYMWWHSLYP